MDTANQRQQTKQLIHIACMHLTRFGLHLQQIAVACLISYCILVPPCFIEFHLALVSLLCYQTDHARPEPNCAGPAIQTMLAQFATGRAGPVSSASVNVVLVVFIIRN